MNIFKYKKIIATALTFVLVIALAGMPLPAKERRGATVQVTMADGSMVKGELLAVKADALLIYDQNARQGKSLDLQQVVQVKVRKESKFGEGLLIGMGAAVGMSIITKLLNDPRNHHSGFAIDVFAGFIGYLPITGLCGGLLGASGSIDKKFSMDGVSSYELQENLDGLKRYAREQD